MINLIVLGIIALLIGLALGYMVKQKKRGSKCIGCPFAEKCAKKHHDNY